MEKIEKISNPAWADEARSAINCIVTINGIEYPFTASPDDSEDYGRDMYEAIMSDKSMEIGEYAPPEPIAVINAEKMRLIAEATDIIAPLQDAVDLDIATVAETTLLAEWKKYRVLLSRAKLDEAWPPKPE
jgi:hypothetical protein